jgi:hypothetical protein
MVAQTEFLGKLAFGQIGEQLIARFKRSEGFTILPAYEKELQTGKGPRLFMPLDGKRALLIAPDMLAMRGRLEMTWIEAKHKDHFTWFAKTGHWQTGIDKRHYDDYLEVMERTQRDVLLYFLHTNDTPPRGKWANGINGRNSQPLHCPIGLFGRTLSELKLMVDHLAPYTDEETGRSYPMVYWDYEDLEEIATLAQVYEASKRGDI